MIRYVVIVSIVLACVGNATPAACSGGIYAQADHHVWKTYTNARFQYAICYPIDLLQPQGESNNGDGEKFLAKDGAQLIVFGAYNALGDTLKDTLDKTASYLAGASGKVTYKVLRANWFVVSGQNLQAIFYAKTLYSHDQFKSFELTYRRSDASIYNPLIGRLAACFVDLGPGL